MPTLKKVQDSSPLVEGNRPLPNKKKVKVSKEESIDADDSWKGIEIFKEVKDIPFNYQVVHQYTFYNGVRELPRETTEEKTSRIVRTLSNSKDKKEQLQIKKWIDNGNLKPISEYFQPVVISTGNKAECRIKKPYQSSHADRLLPYTYFRLNNVIKRIW